jgi:Integrase core domain
MGTPGACKASSSGSAIPSLPPRSGRSCTTPGTGPAPRHAVPTWKQSWTAQAPRGILAAGFVHMDTVLLRRIYALIVIGHGTRRAYLAGITANPDGAWTTQAAHNFLMEPGPRMTGVKFLITDRAGQFTAGFDAVFLAGGITIVASPPQAPKANAICERVIGTLRREVPGRLLIVSECHLRQVLTECLAHYNTADRTAPWANCHQLTLIADRRRSASPSTGSAEDRSSAPSRPSTRSPPESSRPLPKDAGHRPDRVFEPQRSILAAARHMRPRPRRLTVLFTLGRR